MTERAWRPGKLRSGRLDAAARAQLEPRGEALATVAAAMPESERGVCPAQNRHGGAPRGERTDRKVRAAP
jgi:hypothetical protein